MSYDLVTARPYESSKYSGGLSPPSKRNQGTDGGCGTEPTAVQLLEPPLTAATPPVPNVPEALPGFCAATELSICTLVAGDGLRLTIANSPTVVPNLRRPMPGKVLPPPDPPVDTLPEISRFV